MNLRTLGGPVSSIPAGALLFFLAFVLRLGFLILISGPEYTGWYFDSFHHWQIAYYTCLLYTSDAADE